MKLSHKWKEFIGQTRLKSELVAILLGRKKYGTPNLILAGPYGCGKTTLAKLFAGTLGSFLYAATKDDYRLQRINFNISSLDAVIIDEIHLVKKWESLYPALDSSTCIIGATTRPGAIDLPFLSRCTALEFDEYTPKELEKIIKIHLRKLGNGKKIPLDSVVQRSRGVPRVAINTAIRLMRYLEVHKVKSTKLAAEDILTNVFLIDPSGLTGADKKYLSALATASRPVGLRTLSTLTGLDKEYILDIVEPFLMQKQYITLTTSGRLITDGGQETL